MIAIQLLNYTIFKGGSLSSDLHCYNADLICKSKLLVNTRSQYKTKSAKAPIGSMCKLIKYCTQNALKTFSQFGAYQALTKIDNTANNKWKLNSIKTTTRYVSLALKGLYINSATLAMCNKVAAAANAVGSLKKLFFRALAAAVRSNYITN